MARGDIRFSGSQLEVNHRSARGKVRRNSSTFTRGSQLLVHEYLMTFSGIKIPFLIWLSTFVIFTVVMLVLIMNQGEVQLVLMRGLASAWTWMQFDSEKLVNLTIRDGLVDQIYMIDVPKHPAVIAAWGRFWGALGAAFFMSLCFGAPLGVWFVSASTARGSNILEERHERGALLVELPVLRAEVRRHNLTYLREQLGKVDPPMSAQEYEARSIRERVDAGLHQPYSIAGVQYPWKTEQSHTMMIGTTGTGKTTVLREFVSQIQERGHRAVIFDLTGAFVEGFYREDRDTILNPLDARCPAWSIFNDCKSFADFSNAAEALIPSGRDGQDQFWPLAARTLLVEFCMSLVEEGKGTNRDLAEQLLFAELADINDRLKGTVADPLTSTQAAKMAESIRAVLNTHGQTMLMLPDEGEQFSIRKWIGEERKPGSILFITSQYSELTTNKSLLTLWLDMAVNALMRMPRTRDLRTWFMFDEVNALHKIPAIENGLQTARGFGGAFVLGMHSFDKLKQVYGEEGAVALSSLARTKLILAASDQTTAEKCSEYIGQREVRQMEEGYTYGNNPTRDASTLTPRKVVEPLVLPDDIQNLPSLHGYIKFPEGFPAAHIELTYKHYPDIAQGFVTTTRKRLTPRDLKGASPDEMPDEKERADKEAQAAIAAGKDVEAGKGKETIANDNVVPLHPQTAKQFELWEAEQGKGEGGGKSGGNEAAEMFGDLPGGRRSDGKEVMHASATERHDIEQQALREEAKRQAEREQEDDSLKREIREGAVLGEEETEKGDAGMELE